MIRSSQISTNRPPINKAHPLAYCPFTGKFFRKFKYEWREAFLSKNKDGYVTAKVEGKMVDGQRQAMLMRGVDIEGATVDHINRVRHDNRFINLRVLSHESNCNNRGALNVSLLPSGNFRARCGNKHLGVFEERLLAEGAILWYRYRSYHNDKERPDVF